MRTFVKILAMLALVACDAPVSSNSSEVAGEPDGIGDDYTPAREPLGAAGPATFARPRYTYKRKSDPARTEVYDSSRRWVATLTDGCYTVTLRGAQRTFDEATATNPVTHKIWVRVLADPYDGGTVDAGWLDATLADTSDDVLAIAMQYIAGAPSIYDSTGLRIAGDASYGPLVDGVRVAGSDFNDYLGVDWVYADHTDYNEDAQLGCVDCSGYMRLVWGYRAGVPFVGGDDGGGVALPRRAVQIFASAPGVVTIPDTGVQVTDLSRLNVGDLVFFDVDTDDGTDVDHVGMFLGVDAGGRYRFLNSRKQPDGPTLGDYGFNSLLDGSGHYATTFRGARRL